MSIDELTRSSRPFKAINGGTKSILFDLKLSEQLVSIVEVILEDSHGPAIVNSAQPLVYVIVSEVERRFENQRRFAIEPFLERLAALDRIDDVQALLTDFLREYCKR